MKTVKLICIALVVLAGIIALVIFLYIQSIQPKINGIGVLRAPQDHDPLWGSQIPMRNTN